MPSFAAFGNDLYTGRRSFRFIDRRRTWFAIAAVAVLVSLLALGVRGLNAGIEFRGGSEFTISGVASQSEGLATDAVGRTVPGVESRVSKVGTDTVRVQTDRLDDRKTEQVATALASAYKVGGDRVSSSFIGPSWGSDVSNQAIRGLVVFLVLVGLVITLYFRTWKMAASALVALVHDLLLTVGVYALVGFEVTPASVIGFLTILGYSLYDTVVVFDKVRENTEHVLASTRRTYAEAANLAVNQTLVRSINTSVVALLPVAAILFIGSLLLGAGTLKDISLALFVGIAAGTYSSIFIATPLLVELRLREPEIQAQAQRVLRKRTERVAEPVGAPAAGGPASALLTADPDDRDAADGPTGDLPARAPGQRVQPRRGSRARNRPSGRR